MKDNKTLALGMAFFLMMGMSSAGRSQQRLLGGDISLLPSYEESGAQYRDFDGKPVEPLGFFRQLGWNAIRVRLFVEPKYAPQKHREEGVCQDLDYALQLGKRVKEAGCRLLLDLHYSDYWADPGKQTIPHLWKDTESQCLPDSVYEYTRRVLEKFKSEGATPDIIQVGNEISFGMLWPTGRVDPLNDDNWDVLCNLIGHGSRACREVCPKAKIVIHTERTGNWDATRLYYKHLEASRVDYNIIGLSYYPMWHGSIKNLGKTLHRLSDLFPGKEVMIVETAAYYSHDNDRWAKSPDQYAEYYPISPEGQERFTKELIAELNLHPNVTGLFWWFPEENAYGNSLLSCWVNRGLFDNHTGKALPALKAFSGFIPDYHDSSR